MVVYRRSDKSKIREDIVDISGEIARYERVEGGWLEMSRNARLIAHRGGGTLAPENTMGGLRKGHELGFTAVEFDVMLSQDNVPVLMHDERLGRTVKKQEGEMREMVSEYTAAELLAMDAGSWFGEGGEYASESVPSFEQVCSFCKASGLYQNIEIKPCPGYEEKTGEVVARAVADYFKDEIALVERGEAEVTSLPLLSSFSFSALEKAKEVCPILPRAFITSNCEDWEAKCDALQCIYLNTSRRTITEALAAEIKAKGLKLGVYTVNDVEEAARLFDWQVDSIFTDRLDLFIEGK